MSSNENTKISFFDVGYDVEALPNKDYFNFKVIHWSTLFGERSEFNRKDFSNPNWNCKENVHLLKSKTPLLNSNISIFEKEDVFKKTCHFYHHAALIFSIWKLILDINYPNKNVPPHLKEALETYLKEKAKKKAKKKKNSKEAISHTNLEKNVENMLEKLIKDIVELFYSPLLAIIEHETSTIPRYQNILIVLDNLNPIDEISQLFESLETKTTKEFPDIKFFKTTENFAFIKSIIQEDIHNYLQSKDLQNKKTNFLFLHSLLVNKAHKQNLERNAEIFQQQQDFLITNYDSTLFYIQINFFWMLQYFLKMQRKMSFNTNNNKNNDNQNNENTDNDDDSNNDSNTNGNNNSPNGNNNSDPDNDNNNSGENTDNQSFDTESQSYPPSKKRKTQDSATIWKYITSLNYEVKLLYILMIMTIVYVIYMTFPTQTDGNRPQSVNTQQFISTSTSPGMTEERKIEFISRSCGFESKGLSIPSAHPNSRSFFSSSPLFNYFFKKDFL